MVISIVSEFHWTMKEIDNLYIDNIDYQGLVFWYDYLADRVKKINKK